VNISKKRLTFPDLNSAAKGVLLSTVSVLASTRVFFVVAGGWAPVLYEPEHPFLTHPGTRDVDILLLDKVQRSAEAVEALIKAGFRPSAKHEFQLLRSARVASREFVFNVDLMHPLEGSDASDLFRDLFDLDVPDEPNLDASRFVKSIVLPSSSLIAEHSLHSGILVKGTDLDGRAATITAQVITPVGSILSKCASVAQPKRPRDAFDIFYMLTSNHAANYVAELKTLASEVPAFNEELAKLRAFLLQHPDRFENNVGKYAEHHCVGSAAVVSSLI